MKIEKAAVIELVEFQWRSLSESHQVSICKPPQITGGVKMKTTAIKQKCSDDEIYIYR